MAVTIQLPQGDPLIWQTLAPQHDWKKSHRVPQAPYDALSISNGPPHRALHPLERRKWIEPRSDTSGCNQRAPYYARTHTERRRLDLRKDVCFRLTSTIDRVPGTA